MQKPVQLKDAAFNDADSREKLASGEVDLIANTLAALETLRARAKDVDSSKSLQQAMAVLESLDRSDQNNASRYRVLINAVPDAVTLHDESGRIVDANDAACDMYGYPLDQLKRLYVTDLNPDLPHDHMQRMLRTFELGKSVTAETSNRRADGDVFPIEVHSRAYLDNGERRIVAVARDIRERRHAEQELRSAETRYRILLKSMDKGVLVKAADGAFVSANPAACRLLGITEAELTGLTSSDVMKWSFIDEAGEPVDCDDVPGNRALRTGKTIASTVLGIYLPQLHAYRWLSVSAVPQFAAGSDKPTEVISMFSDVGALKREMEMFRTTQALARIGCWELDDLRGTLFWTEHMFQIFDLPPGSPITESRALNFFEVPDRGVMSRALSAARAHAQSFELELQITSSIGRRRWVYVRGQPIVRQGRISGVLGTVQNIDEQKAVEERLQHQASTDPLTGLANRNAILSSIGNAIDNARPGGGPAVLYIDLDRFKVLNDILGHAAGDQLIAAAAQRLATCARGTAELARFGNDEFVMLIVNTRGRKQVEGLAAQIVEVFGKVFESAGEKFALTTSVGIAQYPQDGSNAQDLVRHADAAMTEAKRRGRSMWQEYSNALPHNQPDRLHIEAQLRLALDNNEFHLEYQPKIDLVRGNVVAVEALLRWRSSQLGPLAPNDFIPQAESSGDIVPIGAWVLHESCRQWRQWRDSGLALDHIAVNVSYRQLLSGTLYSTVEAALREYDLPGHMLELEMTERVMIENVADTVEIFRKLKQLGVKLVIDDFGEGYSSLNYLRHLPMDGIKISHTFMQGIPMQTTDSAICEAIVRIATSLGLYVVAEGVETEEQRTFLLNLGTPLAQGFLFSRPLPADKLAAYVAQARQTAKPPVPTIAR